MRDVLAAFRETEIAPDDEHALSGTRSSSVSAPPSARCNRSLASGLRAVFEGRLDTRRTRLTES
jgi:hypothetical protein